MFFLERLESVARPNILGGHSFPVHTHRWKAIYTCPERWPLEEILAKLDRQRYRITSNQPEEGCDSEHQ